MHGANRLGGNSLAEILIFGAHAGKAAAKFSKSLSSQLRSNKIIASSHEYLNSSISKGDENVYLLKSELREIMWKYCGVIRDQKSLNYGLEKLENIQNLLPNVDTRLENNNQNDLINKLDLQSSLITAKATILSAIERKESRGAHQRSDFKETMNNFEFNINVMLKDNRIIIKKSILKDLNKKLIPLLQKSDMDEEFANKLLE